MLQIFSQQEMETLVAESICTIKLLEKVKGGEYAGDDDRLENFRRNAKAIGVPMEVIWRVYAGKHWDSITQYIKDIQTGKERTRLEPMLGRFDDLAVYAILGKAIYLERERNKKREEHIADIKSAVEIPMTISSKRIIEDLHDLNPSYGTDNSSKGI